MDKLKQIFAKGTNANLVLLTAVSLAFLAGSSTSLAIGLRSSHSKAVLLLILAFLLLLVGLAISAVVVIDVYKRFRPAARVETF